MPSIIKSVELPVTHTTGDYDIAFPYGARVLSVAFVNGRVTLYVQTDPANMRSESRKVLIVANTDTFNLDSHRFIGTVNDHGLPLHIYERV